jgi:hypothetical protein
MTWLWLASWFFGFAVGVLAALAFAVWRRDRR